MSHRRIRSPAAATARSLCFLLSVVVALSATLARPRGASADGWSQQQVFGPFVCHADFSLAPYQSLFADLAQIQGELVQRLDIPPAQERIELYLFRDQSSYKTYVTRRFANVPYRQALYVRSGGQAMVLAFRGDDMAVDVRHECTHALLHAVLPMVPIWLDEGLAKYFEVPAADRLTRNPLHSSTKWWMRFGRVPLLPTLESKRTVADMGRTEYRDSWAYFHFLLLGPPAARAELVNYLADIRRGVPPGQLSERMAKNFPDLPGALIEHFKTFGQ